MFPAGPLRIPKLTRPPELIWRVPGSKSITNRALVLAALAEGESTLTGVLHSDDTRYMRNALAALGIEIEDQGPTTLLVRGGRGRLRAPKQPLFVGNSGTTVRFLAALACLVPGPVALVGDEAMARRPIQDLVDGLRQLGVEIDCATGCPPLTIHGGKLPGGALSMRGDRSSQYFSALLMAAVLAEGPVTVDISGTLVSRPYIDITRRMIEDFGGAVDVTPLGYRVLSRSSYHARVHHRARCLVSQLSVRPRGGDRRHDHRSRSRCFGSAGRLRLFGRAFAARRVDRKERSEQHRDGDREPARHRRRHARHLR